MTDRYEFDIDGHARLVISLQSGDIEVYPSPNDGIEVSLSGKTAGVTVEQAGELLPTWKMLQALQASGTAAQAELAAIADKIVQYETDPPRDDPAWFTRGVVVGEAPRWMLAWAPLTMTMGIWFSASIKKFMNSTPSLSGMFRSSNTTSGCGLLRK